MARYNTEFPDVRSLVARRPSPLARHLPAYRLPFSFGLIGLLVAILMQMTTFLRPCSQAGEIEIHVTDQATNQPIAVNLYLVDRFGRTPKPPPRVPFWKDHFSFDGSVQLKLPTGRYTFTMERGPEYQVRTGHFEISPRSEGLEQVSLRRFVDMKSEGWWSGDLHIHRPGEDVPLLMRAQDLHVAPVITWWNDRRSWNDATPPDEPLIALDDDRFYHLLAGEDERGGGALLYFNLARPLDLPGRDQLELPPMTQFLTEARRQPNAHIDIEKPFWWDVPIWLATQQVDSIGLANNHMQRAGMLANEAWGKPRDRTFYPDPRGNGYWSQDIYYHILNCGIRLPPSAGSASGVLPNPVGYNRVYVHCPNGLTWSAWWEGLRAGRVVVTNGPLLRPQVNGHYPGHVFSGRAGQAISLITNLRLSLQDRVDYLELVKNGEVVHEIRLDEYRQRKGSLPAIEFSESGWMLLRAIASQTNTFRFASTGPYYVEIDQRPRISRASVQFFLDWLDERHETVKEAGPAVESAVADDFRRARLFWETKLRQANAP